MNMNERKCNECLQILPINKFENTRNTCKTCRGRKQKQSRIDRDKYTIQEKMIQKKKKEDCNNICQICGLDNPLLITFDHLEPENKAKKLNGNTINSLRELSTVNLDKELKKPHQWICHNCHKIKTKNTTFANTRDFGCVVNNELIKILGGQCEICEEDREFTLCFDHIDESLKEFTIGNTIQQLRLRKDGGVPTEKTNMNNILKICEEVKKCGLLCNNCNWLKEYYRQLSSSKNTYDNLPYFDTEEKGKEFVEKLNNYKDKARNYVIDSNEIFDIAETYKNEIIDEKFNEQKDKLDIVLYNGILKFQCKYNQYGRITLSDIILDITKKGTNQNKELPLGIFKQSNNSKYRVQFINKWNSFQTLQDAIDYKNNIILDDIEKLYTKNSSIYSYINSLLNNIN